MTIFTTRKYAALFSLHCCFLLCCCAVLPVTCPHDENVTCCIRDITPRDARRKQKYRQL